MLSAYRNGLFVPESQLSIPVSDAGFIQGVTVAEQLRTFGGRLFRLPHHLQRLRRSLQVVGIELGDRFERLSQDAQELAERNHRQLTAGDDLVLGLFVTPGPYATFAADETSAPLVGMHTHPLPFHLWCDKYDRGQRLTVTGIQQVPAECWPPELKCRSRMHYYLADRQAQQLDPGSRALLLDREGRVMEASTASVVLYRREEGFLSPRAEHILPGVSIGVLAELAAELGIPFQQQDLEVTDVLRSDEVLLCSTSPCLLPVVSLNGHAIGEGAPGELFRRMLGAWGRLVGIDIPAQSLRFRTRAVRPSQ